jgi:hypothetical protein
MALFIFGVIMEEEQAKEKKTRGITDGRTYYKKLQRKAPAFGG